MSIGFIWLKIGASFCEHNSELSDSTEDGKCWWSEQLLTFQTGSRSMGPVTFYYDRFLSKLYFFTIRNNFKHKFGISSVGHGRLEY
jgi:hypothetical protein